MFRSRINRTEYCDRRKRRNESVDSPLRRGANLRTRLEQSNMQTTATKSLLPTDSSFLWGLAERETRFGVGGLYHHLAVGLFKGIHNSESVRRWVAKLVTIAERAYPLRQFDIVSSVGQALLDAPVARRYESIGLFYQGLGISRSGSGDTDHARAIIERVADEGTSLYRAKAMLALGVYAMLVEDRTAPSFCSEAIRILSSESIFDPMTVLRIRRMTAIVRAKDGDHAGALADLENSLPLARAAGSIEPAVYHDHLNSLAVELGEVGRIEEARRVARVVVASPFVGVYPEWRETLDEIDSRTQPASRSVVTISRVPSERRASPAQLISWPGDRERQITSNPMRAKNSALIINLHDWKKKLAMKSTGNTQERLTQQQIKSMTLTEKQARIARYIYDDQVSEDMLDSILAITARADTGERDEG